MAVLLGSPTFHPSHLLPRHPFLPHSRPLQHRSTPPPACQVYVAVLLGSLAQDSDGLCSAAAALLAGGSLGPVVASVERCLAFYVQVTPGECLAQCLLILVMLSSIVQYQVHCPVYCPVRWSTASP